MILLDFERNNGLLLFQNTAIHPDEVILVTYRSLCTQFNHFNKQFGLFL